MRQRTIHSCYHLSILAWFLGIASAQVVITGVVTGHDGKPMPTAQVRLANAADERIDSATVGPDGAFELRAPQPGLLRVQFAGPLHGRKDALILVDQAQTISISAHLTAPDYSTELTNLRLRTGDPKSPLNGRPLVLQPDGTFVAEIESDAPDLLLAVGGLSTTGPPVALAGASEYRCVDLTCYAVGRPAAGKLRIVLDPSRLMRTTEPAWVHYLNPDSPVAVAGSVLDRTEAFMFATRAARQETARKSGKAMNEIIKEPPPAERVKGVMREIERERVPLARQARFFEYLSLVFLGAPADRALVRHALDELTPSSQLWAMFFGNIAGQAIVATGEPEKYVEYAMKIMGAQPSKALEANAAAGLISTLGAAIAEPLIAKARAEAGDQPMVKMVLAQFGAERRIQPGKPVPAFRAPSLDNPAVEYTEASLKGHVYLIDFWATWCMPCITEFPGLTRLYEKYRGQGFEILSYSIDSEPNIVRQFRKERFPMPWLHAIDPELRELQSPMAKDFEVLSIPRPVLVDARGIVVGTDQECRGSRLEDLLKRVLPPASAAH